MISNASPDPIKKIVVLGGGTAGFLSALAFKRHLKDVEVVIVRSTKMGVIGVGEGTIPSVVSFLRSFLGIDARTLYSKCNASPKLGIRYLWGPRPFFNYTFTGQLVLGHKFLDMPRGYYCEDDFEFADLNSALMCHDNVCIRLPNGQPKPNPNVAYHLENKKFVGFLEELADEWGIKKVDDIVKDTTQNENGIEKLILESGQEVTGDLFIDCSGFRSELIGKAFDEEFVDYTDALFCDKAVVGGWRRQEDDVYHPYTTAETMDNGWCWKIEHDELVNRGYVFCSSFVSDDEAVREYREKNPKVEVAKVISYNSGVRRRTWVKNVVAIGNAAGFVEPLEATAIGMICDAALRLTKALLASGNRNLPIQRNIFNRISSKNWDIIRDFLALHYKFNSRIDTPFWRAAQADVNIGEAQEMVDYYKTVGPDFSILTTELKRDFFTAEGYLVMLLGQDVGYDREVAISPEQRANWTKLKTNLNQLAGNGLNVPEFLQLMRTHGQHAFNNSIKTNLEKMPDRIGHGENLGELNWH